VIAMCGVKAFPLEKPTPARAGLYTIDHPATEKARHLRVIRLNLVLSHVHNASPRSRTAN
jgi:hypothetical protein